LIIALWGDGPRVRLPRHPSGSQWGPRIAGREAD